MTITEEVKCYPGCLKYFIVTTAFSKDSVTSKNVISGSKLKQISIRLVIAIVPIVKIAKLRCSEYSEWPLSTGCRRQKDPLHPR